MKNKEFILACVVTVALAIASFRFGMSYQKQIQLPAIQKVVNVGRSTINNLSQQLATCDARLKEAHRVNDKAAQKRIRTFDDIFQQGKRG